MILLESLKNSTVTGARSYEASHTYEKKFTMKKSLEITRRKVITFVTKERNRLYRTEDARLYLAQNVYLHQG